MPASVASVAGCAVSPWGLLRQQCVRLGLCIITAIRLKVLSEAWLPDVLEQGLGINRMDMDPSLMQNLIQVCEVQGRQQ